MRSAVFARSLLPAVLTAFVFACSGDDTVEPVPEFALTVTVEGDGSGRVTSTPSGIDCTGGGGTCSMSVAEGTSVTLTASAEAGSELAGWTGACTSDPCMLTMAGARSVTATFDDPFLEVATIGPAGGELTSADGAVTLVVPAGALADDEDLTIDIVEPGALGSEWADVLSDVDVAWELGPDGTTFAEPVTVALVSEQSAPLADGTVEIGSDFLWTSDGSVVTELSELTVELDADAGTAVVRGTLEHFSPLVKARTVGGGRFYLNVSNVPASAEVGRGFTALVSLMPPEGWTPDEGTADDASSAYTWVDESSAPVVQAREGDRIPGALLVPYDCSSVAPGEFRGAALMGAGTMGSRATRPFRLSVRKQVQCKEATRTVTVEQGATDGSGTVTSSPEGISCHLTAGGGTGTCSAVFGAQVTVVLTAAPDDGSGFAGWKLESHEEGSTTLTFVPAEQVFDPIVVDATFQKVPLIDLSVLLEGGGTGTIRDEANGVTCEKTVPTEDASCEVQVPEGTRLSLMHEAGTNAVFAGWEGCDEVVDDACEVEVVPDLPPVTAVFEAAPEAYALTVTKEGMGTVRGIALADPDDVDSFDRIILECGDTCSGVFYSDDNLAVEGKAADGWRLAGWSGDCSGTDERLFPPTTADLTCHATFVEEGDATEPPLATFSFDEDGLSMGAELLPGDEIEVPLRDGDEEEIGTLDVMLGSSGEYAVPSDESLEARGGGRIDLVWPAFVHFDDARIIAFGVGGLVGGGNCSLIYEAFGPDRTGLGRVEMDDVGEVYVYPTIPLPPEAVGLGVFFEGSACTSDAYVILGSGELTNGN